MQWGGVSPLDLWHDYGIISYNLAMSGQTLALNYYSLKSAIKVSKPKVVVADVSYIFMEDQNAEGSTARRHQLIDNMPWNRGKLDAVAGLVEPEEWQDYLFNISYYHERWKELTANDFTSFKSLNKGCVLISCVKDGDGNFIDAEERFKEMLPIIPKEEKMEIPVMAREYVEKIAELCKEEDIELVFVAYPAYAWGKVNHGNGDELQKMWNKFSDVVAEYGVNYINYMHEFERISFNPQEDLADWRHLSYTGAEKVTSDLGKFLVCEYDMEDRRNDISLREWESQWNKLEDLKQELREKKLKEKESAQERY